MEGSEEVDRRTRPVFVRSQADSVLLSDRVLANLLVSESHYAFKVSDYMAQVQRSLAVNHRKIVTDWMLEVCQESNLAPQVTASSRPHSDTYKHSHQSTKACGFYLLCHISKKYFLMSGVPELRDLPGHRAGPDEPPALAAAAPGLGLPQPRLQAERPATPVPVQARGGHGLQLQPGGAAGHGDGGAAEAAVGALLPLPPPLPVAAAGPARHAALRRAAAAGGEAGRDLPDAGGHRVQVLQCQTLHHGQYRLQTPDT